MPTQGGIGQSKATKDKQDGFRKIIGQHLATCQQILTKHRRWASPIYQYIDTNAGCGQNEMIGCDGSPVIFLQSVAHRQLRYHAHLIEISADNSQRLQETISQWNNFTIITGDNGEVVPSVVGQLPDNSYGLLYSDPNGIPDFEMIAAASHNPKMKKIDILIRYAASAVKRNQHITGIKMLDYLRAINKRHWIVRELDCHDRWQWTFLLGLNWGGLRSWKSQGFYYADSEEGQRIIERLNFTNQELEDMRQPKLFEPDLHTQPYKSYDEYLRHPTYRAIRAQAVKRSGGICEKCHTRPVTEVHHVRYPKWGEFDTIDNLLALCHQCHCQIHGKEN